MLKKRLKNVLNYLVFNLSNKGGSRILVRGGADIFYIPMWGCYPPEYLYLNPSVLQGKVLFTTKKGIDYYFPGAQLGGGQSPPPSLIKGGGMPLP